MITAVLGFMKESNEWLDEDSTHDPSRPLILGPVGRNWDEWAQVYELRRKGSQSLFFFNCKKSARKSQSHNVSHETKFYLQHRTWQQRQGDQTPPPLPPASLPSHFTPLLSSPHSSTLLTHFMQWTHPLPPLPQSSHLVRVMFIFSFVICFISRFTGL